MGIIVFIKQRVPFHKNRILPKTTRRLKNHLWKMKKHIDFLVEKG